MHICEKTRLLMASTNSDSLREALKHSPSNHALRLLLAEALMAEEAWSEAEQEFKAVLDAQPDNQKARKGLVKVVLEQGQYATAIVVREEGIDKQDVDTLLVLAKAYLRNSEADKAAETYKTLLSLNPAFKDEELDSLRSTAGNSSSLEGTVAGIESQFNMLER